MNEFLDEKERILNSYMDDIAHWEPLSREREAELATRIIMGDMEARNELVRGNLRYVVSVAKKYQNYGLPLVDLIGAGNLGMVTAAGRFDATKGLKFITYAVWWIRQSILKTISEQSRIVRLPVNKVGFIQRITGTANRLRQEYNREPKLEKLWRSSGTHRTPGSCRI